MRALFLPLMTCAALIVSAQAEEQARSFSDLLSTVVNGNTDADFRSLRYAWATSQYFDPAYRDGAVWISFLDQLRSTIDGEDVDLERALDSCQHIPPAVFLDVRLHILCINAMAALGDSERESYHRRIVDGLQDSIGSSAFASSGDDPFVVVNDYEAIDFVTRDGMRILSIEVDESDPATQILTTLDEFGVRHELRFVHYIGRSTPRQADDALDDSVSGDK